MRLPPLAAAAALSLCAPALAQTFSGVGPTPTLVLPRADGAGPMPAETLRTETLRPVPRAPALRRLPSVAAPLRIWGENGQITWMLYATEAQARAGGRFRLATLAAVSVLPETSRLTLTLNGAPIGETTVDGTRGLRIATFDIAPGALVPGHNALRLAAVQHHRVDCSVAATYELWTQVDAEHTGFLPAVDGLSDPADLAAVGVAPDGSTPLRLLQTGERLSERAVERALAALQGAALAGRLAQPAAEFAPAPGTGEGLTLAVGTAGQLKGIDLSALGTVAGARLALLPATPERQPVLVATGAGEAEVNEAVAQLARLAARPPRGSAAGLAALADASGRRIEGGESLTLADLGVADAQVVARTYRVAFDLALPHDMLPADYGRLVLDLDARYPAGLAAGAQIVVDINGVNAASAPLGRRGGETLRRRAVFLPLRLLRPGLNRVSITAELPRDDDRVCAGEAGVPTERLTLLASTRLTIPPLARVSRQPELAETFAAGAPYAGAPRRPTLAVPAPDRDTMAAAATLAARLGLAAGRPIPFAFAAGRGGIAGPTVVVSPARALDASVIAAAGLDPARLRDAWAPRETAAAAEAGPAARRLALRRDGIGACRARRAGLEEPVAEAASAAGPDLAQASAVVAQGVTGAGSDEVVTLVTAPSAALLREAVDCLVHPRVWNRPQGRAAMLSASDGALANRTDDSPRYVLTAPHSLANLRRIAAGWLSVHAGLYGLFALLVAGGLAGSTRLLVRNLGRRSS